METKRTLKTETDGYIEQIVEKAQEPNKTQLEQEAEARADSIKDLSYLSTSSLTDKADEVNRRIEQLEGEIQQTYDQMADKLKDIQQNQTGTQRHINALEAYLTAQAKVMELDKARTEAIEGYFTKKQEIAQAEYEKLLKNASAIDLTPSDYMYIQQMMNHGTDADIAELAKRYSFHPIVLNMIKATKKDIEIKHPLEIIADRNFQRNKIREYTGAYYAMRKNFLDRMKQEIPAWIYPLPDELALKDPWGMRTAETPQDALKRLKTTGNLPKSKGR